VHTKPGWAFWGLASFIGNSTYRIVSLNITVASLDNWKLIVERRSGFDQTGKILGKPFQVSLFKFDRKFGIPESGHRGCELAEVNELRVFRFSRESFTVKKRGW